jgi:hypothetical protein
MSRKMRALDYIAISVVFLNITNAYTLLSAMMGVSFSIVAVGMISVLGLNLCFNQQIIKRILRRRVYVTYLLLFFLVPALSTLTTPSSTIKHLGYVLLSALIFTNCSILIIKMGWQNMSRYILFSWMTGVAFIVISYFFPDFFERIAIMQHLASSETGSSVGEVKIAQAASGRAFGLYMQSNRACLAMGLHLLMLLPIYFHQRHSARMIILGVTFFAVLLTGSRGGFVYMGVISLLLVAFEMSNGVRVGGRVQRGITVVPKYILLMFLSVIALFSAEFYSGVNDVEISPVQRILESFFGDGVDLTDDQSVVARLDAQEMYLQKIAKSPLIGHGIGARAHEKIMGTLLVSSHNNILETAYNYGVILAFSTYGFFVYLACSKQSIKRRRDFKYDISWMLVIFIVISSFTINTLFDYRVFPMMMAFWMGMLYFPISSNSVRKG